MTGALKIQHKLFCDSTTMYCEEEWICQTKCFTQNVPTCSDNSTNSKNLLL